MGWAARGQVKLRPRLVSSGPDRVADIQEMSKRRMAQVLNEQSGRFQQLREHQQALMKLVLGAIVDHGGVLQIPPSAIEQVKAGMTLRVRETAGAVTLTIDETEPEPSVD